MQGSWQQVSESRECQVLAGSGLPWAPGQVCLLPRVGPDVPGLSGGGGLHGPSNGVNCQGVPDQARWVAVAGLCIQGIRSQLWSWACHVKAVGPVVWRTRIKLTGSVRQVHAFRCAMSSWAPLKYPLEIELQ